MRGLMYEIEVLQPFHPRAHVLLRESETMRDVRDGAGTKGTHPMEFMSSISYRAG